MSNIPVGIVPVKELSFNAMLRHRVSNPRSEGIVPSNRFRDQDRAISELDRRPSSDGMVPVS